MTDPLTHLVIRNLDLGAGVTISPMVAITDLPYRRMCRAFGADLTFCEMVAGPMLAAAERGKVKQKSLKRMETEPEEYPFGVQLFGSMPEALFIGAQYAAESGADLIDLNMGCPTRRVAGSGSGSGLLRKPDLARECVAAIRKAIPDMPFTVKIRAGWDHDLINGVEIARMAEGEGADAVTVHGRLRSQTYHDPANWDWIAQVVAALKIPVIGNGDIMEPEDAVEMVRRTGCKGVMIGRGARGNPWLIRDAKALLSGMEKPAPPTPAEKFEVFLKYWKDLAAFRGEAYAIKDIRKHIIWFSKGMTRAVELRRALSSLNNEETLIERVRAFFLDEAQDRSS